MQFGTVRLCTGVILSPPRAKDLAGGGVVPGSKALPPCAKSLTRLNCAGFRDDAIKDRLGQTTRRLPLH
jgi:hypothetical protein